MVCLILRPTEVEGGRRIARGKKIDSKLGFSSRLLTSEKKYHMVLSRIVIFFALFVVRVRMWPKTYLYYGRKKPELSPHILFTNDNPKQP